MDAQGKMSILFDQDIMWPDYMDQKTWDGLLEVMVQSNDDDQIYRGRFYHSRRALKTDKGESHPF